jgi:ribosomal protein S18 acetylase RimI-like enzyme
MRSVVQIIRHDLRFFGVTSTFHDMLIRAVNRIAFCKVLKVLKADCVDPRFFKLGPEYRAQFLTRSQTIELLDEPEFEVSESFLESAWQKGDECFGIFLGATLVSFGWYSIRTTETSDDLTISVPPGHVYIYKAYTSEKHRGRRLNAIGITLAMNTYLGNGYRAILSYVESNNFSSLNSFGRIGFHEIGRLWILRVMRRTIMFPSRGLTGSRIVFKNRPSGENREPLQACSSSS